MSEIGPLAGSLGTTRESQAGDQASRVVPRSISRAGTTIRISPADAWLTVVELTISDRLVDHHRRVLDERRQIVGEPGGGGDVVETGDHHVLGDAEADGLADRVHGAHREQVVGAEDRIRPRLRRLRTS